MFARRFTVLAPVLLASGGAVRSQDKDKKSADADPPPKVETDVDPFVARVAEVLQNRNVTWEKGANACVSLGKQGAKAVPVLPAAREFIDRFLQQVSALQEYSENRQQDEWLARALRGIAELGPDAAPLVPSLENILAASIRSREQNQYYRFTQSNKAAAFALGRIGSPKSIPALVKAAIEDKEADVRSEVVGALGKLAAVNSSTPDVLKEVIVRLRVLLETDESDVVKALAKKTLAQAEGKEIDEPKDKKGDEKK